ncbi:unnamed protein product [Closterium sp. NIES-65]|nr:unnamed protein product [Closterium sp. NIES-65]
MLIHVKGHPHLPAAALLPPPPALAALPLVRPLSLSADPSLDLSSPHADLDSLLPATGAVLLLHDREAYSGITSFLTAFPLVPLQLSLSSGPSLDLSSPHADLASLLPATGAVLLLHDRGRLGAEGETGEKGSEGAEGEKGPTVEEGKEGGTGESSREDDAELARRLQEEEDAALAQQMQQSEAHAMQAMLQQMRGQQQPPQQQQGQAALERRLLSLWSNVMQYEDPSRQAKARSLIPLQQLEEAAAVSLAKQGQYQPSEEEFRDALLRQLLVWFKSWFRWVDSPPCPRCRTPTCAFHGSSTPSTDDLLWGGERVELHRCKQCGTVARFVRYNDPAKLLDTREGRCGEWANAFTLCCRALGYDARQAVDWTDHVWTECYSHAKQRWLHLDPCEAAFDTPLLYEKGWGKKLLWGKKLSYVFGVGRDGVADVIRRYTRKWSELQHRRTEASEAAVATAVAAVTARARASLNVDERRRLEERDAREREELSGGRGGGKEGGGEEGGVRDGVVLGGRQTGSVEWRAARGELGLENGEGDGGDKGKEGKDGRLERRMVDEHVGAPLLAVGDMCRYVIGSPSLEAASAAAETAQKSLGTSLDALLSLLSVLRSLPFRSRSLPFNDNRCDPFRTILLDALATSTVGGTGGAVAASGTSAGSGGSSAAAVPLLSLLTAMGVQIWKEEEGEKEGSEGAGWIVGVKECEAEGVEGASAEARKEKGGVVAEEKGVGGWRYGKRAVLAAMAMEAAQEVLPRVKQALEMRAGNGGGGDASWLQGLVQHERVCGGMVSADGENAPNEMAVSACDAALHTKWLHHEGGKGKMFPAAMPYWWCSLGTGGGGARGNRNLPLCVFWLDTPVSPYNRAEPPICPLNQNEGKFCLSRLAFRQPLFTGKWDSQRREELGVGTPTFYP